MKTTAVKSQTKYDNRRILFIIGSAMLIIGAGLCFIVPAYGILLIMLGGSLYGAIALITARLSGNRWQVFVDTISSFLIW